MGKAIIIASGKGGTGKTTTAAALSSRLAFSGSNVLCIDADAGLKNLDLCLGLSDKAVFDFGDVLSGRCGLDEAVASHPDIPRLFFLTAPLDPDYFDSNKEGFAELIGYAKNIYDFCIIDAPAGIGSGFAAAAEAADSAIIVSASDPSSCRDSGRVVQELKRLGKNDIRLIINRVNTGVLYRTKLTIDDAIDSIGAQLIGIVPEDLQVILAATAQKPLALCYKSRALAAYDRISGRLLGKKVKIRL